MKLGRKPFSDDLVSVINSLFAAGKTSKEVSQILSISDSAAKRYRAVDYEAEKLIKARAERMRELHAKGHGPVEIAKMLNCTVGQVKYRVNTQTSVKKKIQAVEQKTVKKLNPLAMMRATQ